MVLRFLNQRQFSKKSKSLQFEDPKTAFARVTKESNNGFRKHEKEYRLEARLSFGY